MEVKPVGQSDNICVIHCIDILGCMESDSSNPYIDCLVNEERRLIDERTNVGTVEKKKIALHMAQLKVTTIQKSLIWVLKQLDLCNQY
ncbi:unnamed protein product [Gordionus sp. m RMFG-2023]